MLRLLFLLTLLYTDSTLGWTTSLTSHTNKKQAKILSKLNASYPSKNDNHDDDNDGDDKASTNRRDFLSSASFTVTAAATAATATTLFGGVMTSSPTMAVATDGESDPFAEFDKIAQGIQGSSNYPNSISPLPTYKLTEKDLTADESSSSSSTSGTIVPPASDMEQALNDIKKKKQINPTTHG